MATEELVPTTNYENCGRKKSLTVEQERAVTAFVKTLRNRFFCTCHYIRNELNLPVTPKTINNVLNNAGYYWRSVPRIQGLSKEQLEKRQVFVDAHIDYPPAWWLAHFNMVLDGVTLTMAPMTLSGREKHAAQRLSCNWTREGERLNLSLIHI